MTTAQPDVLVICRALVQAGYKPYAGICLADTPECISYPFPAEDGHGIGIMVRAKDDPTTMIEYRIPETVIQLALEAVSPASKGEPTLRDGLTLAYSMLVKIRDGGSYTWGEYHDNLELIRRAMLASESEE